MTDEPVRKRIHVSARPETVFRFLVDPVRLVRWLGVAAEIDPRPGGAIRIDVNGRDVVAGEIVALEPPHRIVLTWGWDRDGTAMPPGSTTVEITLEPEGEGTRLDLVHRDLPPENREPHDRGWDHYLERLSTCAEGGDPGPDPLASREIVHGAPGSTPGDRLADTKPETEGEDA